MKTTFTILLLLIVTIIKAQTTPKPLWIACYNDSIKSQGFETDMTTDAYGNTYITGYVQDTSSANLSLTHFYLLKNDAFGVQQWVKYFPADTVRVSRYNTGTAVAADANGNVYVTGTTYDTICNTCTIVKPNEDAFTIKYNSLGNIIWINRYAGGDSTYQTAADIALANDGNIYTVGAELTYNRHLGVYEKRMYTQKIKANGSNAWVEKIQSAVGNAITIARSGNIIIGGAADPYNSYQQQSPEIFVYKASGDTLWTRTFNQPGKYGVYVSIKTDASGNIYANGQTDTLTFNDIPRAVLFKYSSAGDSLWYKKGPAYSRTGPHVYGDFSLDTSGNVYTAFSFTNSGFYLSKWIITKYNSAGKQLWSNIYRDSIYTNDNPTALVTDISGNVYVTGNTYVLHKKNQFYTTLMYNATGVLQWSATYPTVKKSGGFANNIGLDALQNVYVSGSATAGICTLKYPAAVAAAKKDLPAITSVINNSGIFVYPNPCNDVLYFTNTKLNGNYFYTVRDLTGRTVKVQNNVSLIKGGIQSFSVKDLLPGFYFLQLSNKTDSYTAKFIKQ